MCSIDKIFLTECPQCRVMVSPVPVYDFKTGPMIHQYCCPSCEKLFTSEDLAAGEYRSIDKEKFDEDGSVVQIAPEKFAADSLSRLLDWAIKERADDLEKNSHSSFVKKEHSKVWKKIIEKLDQERSSFCEGK